MNFFLLKALTSVCLVPIWSDRSRGRVERLLVRLGGTKAVGVFAISRLAPCLLAFLVLKLKFPEDSVEWAKLVTGSSEQSSPYSLGFDYLLRGLWSVVPSPLTFVLAMIAAEVFAFAIFWRTAADDFRNPIASGVLAFWVVNPISLFHISLGGQDEALILLAWSAVVWAVTLKRPRLAGLLGALGVFFSKILGGVACLPLLVQPARKVVVGCNVFVGVLLGLVVALLILHVPVLGFLGELNYLTSGNVWAIPDIVWPGWYRRAILLEVAVAGVAMAGSVMYIRTRPLRAELPQILRLTGTVGCVFLLFSPKSPTAWLLMFLPGILFLIMTIESRLRGFLIAFFLPVSAFEPSLWFHFGQGESLGSVAWGRPLMLVVDSVLVAGYAVLIWHGLRVQNELQWTAARTSEQPDYRAGSPQPATSCQSRAIACSDDSTDSAPAFLQDGLGHVECSARAAGHFG